MLIRDGNTYFVDLSKGETDDKRTKGIWRVNVLTVLKRDFLPFGGGKHLRTRDNATLSQSKWAQIYRREDKNGKENNGGINGKEDGLRMKKKEQRKTKLQVRKKQPL